MNREELNESDWELVALAKEIIKDRHQEKKHSVSAVLRTKSGNVFEGIHLNAYVSRIDVCAEAIAIGHAAIKGDTDIDTIVAVYKTGKVVSPCGMCRELIGDYSPDAKVILHDSEGEYKVKVSDLLPLKYKTG